MSGQRGLQFDHDKTQWKNGTSCSACAALEQSRSIVSGLCRDTAGFLGPMKLM